MRIENYTRELTEDGYMVVGSSTYDIEPYDVDMYAPIKMSLFCGAFCNLAPNAGPVYDNLEELIEIAEVTSDYSEDFAENYAEIMRGNRPDWHLGRFDVYVGGITLYFGNRTTGETGSVCIDEARELWLTFECPRTRLGFDPIYNVRILHGEDTETMVEEELGYMYRRIYFKLKDSARESDGGFPEDNQYLEITECVDM